MRLPITLVQGVEPLLESLASVATRALTLLDDVEDLPGRIREVLERADAITTRVDVVVDEAAAALSRVQPAIEVIGTLDLEVLARLTPLLDDLAVLLAGARELDPSLVRDGQKAVHAVPILISVVENDLLPALANLEALVPVVAQLGVYVDHLDGTVTDVSSLLAGIPGAARLLKRGTTPRTVVQPSI